MATVSPLVLQVWHDYQCTSCTKRKADKPKQRCQIWHALFIAKTPVALQNASKFIDKFGMCKGYDPEEVR